MLELIAWGQQTKQNNFLQITISHHLDTVQVLRHIPANQIKTKFIFCVTTQYYNVYNGNTQKAAKEALSSLNWPPKQTTEHNITNTSEFRRNRWTDVRTDSRTDRRRNK